MLNLGMGFFLNEGSKTFELKEHKFTRQACFTGLVNGRAALKE